MTEATLPLFYRRPRPLDSAQDARFSLAAGTSYQFAAQTNASPLLASEFGNACRQYPIVFAAADLAQPLALLGLRNGENLFVDEAGHWASDHHIPAYIRRYPFIFMESPDQQQFTLCIDEAASSVVESPENPLFKDGNPTEVTRNALNFCRSFQGGYAYTMEFAKALVTADLLVENRADITLRNGERLSLSGFRVIDEQRFNQLPDAVFLHWRTRGWLHLVYSHLLSINSWNALINRKAAAS